MHLQYYLPPKIGNELTETKYKRIKIMPALCFSPESFGNTERFRMFVMPNIASRIGSRITYETADKAGLLLDDSTCVGSRCLATSWGSASCYIHIANFFLTMPNTGKVSSKTVKNSSRTASIYQVTIEGYVNYQEDTRYGLVHTDLYQAANEEEAIGMAVNRFNSRYSLFYIKGNAIKCSLLNPLAL